MPATQIVAKSPIGFDDAKVKQITDALNADIATLFQLFKQFKKHEWYLSGTEYQMLHTCYANWADRALEDADEIAKRVVAVGGVPINPASAEAASAFKFEAADVPGVRQMLENDLTAEQALFGKLREHIPLLENQGDYASSILLRHILKEEEDIARKLALYIQHEGLAHALIHAETKKP
ncbi:MAG TPA: ferritin-like domain-containing protein [Symbiobacteriaceae bacterium]|jgi:DNA-binding ferritin-like protein